MFWFKGARSESALGQTPEERAAELPDIRSIRKACTLALDDLAGERGEQCGYELSLLVVHDEEMQLLNREHRGVDRPTDVLSFPLLEGSTPAGPAEPADGDGAPHFWVPGALPVGDVVIAIETCHRQAEQVGHSVREEFWRLLVHGLLHLFEHDTPVLRELRNHGLNLVNNLTPLKRWLAGRALGT